MDKIFKPCHVLHGESHARAYWQCGPVCVQADCPQEYWALLPQAIARAFCGNLVEKHMTQSNYFEPSMHWPKPILANPELNITLTRLQYLGNTKSRREMNVFAAANPARLPLAMGLVQHGVPFTRKQRTGLVDALVLILKRFLTPASWGGRIKGQLFPRDASVPSREGEILTQYDVSNQQKRFGYQTWFETPLSISHVKPWKHGDSHVLCGDCCLTACSAPSTAQNSMFHRFAKCGATGGLISFTHWGQRTSVDLNIELWGQEVCIW